MERDARRMEHVKLSVVIKILHQAQGRWLGDVEVVAGEEPQPPTAFEQIAQMRQNQPCPGRHQERDGEIDRLCLVDQRPKVRVQGILTARDQRAVMRGAGERTD